MKNGTIPIYKEFRLGETGPSQYIRSSDLVKNGTIPIYKEFRLGVMGSYQYIRSSDFAKLDYPNI